MTWTRRLRSAAVRHKGILGVRIAISLGAAGVAGRAQEQLWRVDGDATGGDTFGFALVAPGDVDGDGVDDLVVSDPGWRSASQARVGAVYAYSGATYSLLWKVEGSEDIAKFGWALASIGDVDGDTHPDIAVGAPWNGASDEGRVFVYSGATGAVIRTISGTKWVGGFGFSVAGVGDLDKDGTADLAIGEMVGSAYVYSGATWQVLPSLRWEPNADAFGSSIAGAGDIDRDGYPDLVVGAPGASTNGHVYNGHAIVYSGKTGALLREFVGTADHDSLGTVVCGGGDVDRDGIPDVLVKSMGVNSGSAGSVIAYSGATGVEITEWNGSSPNDIVSGGGDAIAIAGDLDHDGSADVVVGAIDLTTNLGRLHVYSGRTHLELWTMDGSEALAEFGYSVAGQLDFNQDGILDIAVGADHASSHGAVYVFSGAAAPSVASITPERGPYECAVDLTIVGANFSDGVNLEVKVGGEQASNIVLIDDTTITCTADSGDPGPTDLVVKNSIGTATLRAGFTRTPATVLEGDFVPGGDVTARFLCEPCDGVLAIYGLPPKVSLPTPPYQRNLCIVPFSILLLMPPGIWPLDELELEGDLPDDPSLSGLDVLFQALIGPTFSGRHKDATWTNCAVMSIQ